jgi:probable HAF family extracellular repeat protein
MKKLLILCGFVVALALPARGSASVQFPYRLLDLGTFGGPQAGQGNGPYINASGVVAGTADTPNPDPYAPQDTFNGDPYVEHGFSWQKGTLTDLGALSPQDANSSYPNGINARGDEAGLSNNGLFDPLAGMYATVATLWRDGSLINLGTLGGNESQAFALNNRDQIVGVAANAVPDPLSMLGWGTQARAFLWQEGVMHDLGTLGGSDSFAWNVNAGGEVAGVSYTSDVVNPATGLPQTDAFLWRNGAMRDLGSLGGDVFLFGGVAALNNRGEVVGVSGLAGDQTVHPYLWDGMTMVDLGTLGGDNGFATDINQSGAVSGIADLADGTHHAFLWAGGVIHDLQSVDGAPCSNANSINDTGEVVGNATDCQGHELAAVLWQAGSGVDLNTLVAPSPLHLTNAVSLNNAGEIIGYGELPDGSEHNFLLIPNGH